MYSKLDILTLMKYENMFLKVVRLTRISFLLGYGNAYVNSSPTTAAYKRRWNGSSLVQVMACRLFGAKPLPKPMLDYCRLDTWEQISVKFQ